MHSSTGRCHKFFVYGTLKKGGYFAREFDHIRKSNKPAKLKGFSLYSLGQFPAVWPGDGEVIGELHEYDEEHCEYVLRRIDRIEGFDGTQHSFYFRREIEVETEDGEIELAYVYVLNNARFPGISARKIASGIWDV